MATSVTASQLQNVLLTFSFHSYNHYGNACYSLKMIIVVTKILATILAIPGYSQPAYTRVGASQSTFMKDPSKKQTCLIAIARYLAIFI